MFSSFYVSLQFAFINILFAITRTPADERCALKHQSISASCKTCKYRHYIIPEASTRRTADCLLNISSGVDQRASTRNINQSQLRIPQSLPSHSGVSTVTGMSALIRAKGCWSGHPGWLSSQASHYAASRSCLSLSRSCSLRGWIILNHRIRRARLSSRPMTGFEPHTECGFKGQARYKRTHWNTAYQCKIQKQETRQILTKAAEI